jgi:hypothetical protein
MAELSRYNSMKLSVNDHGGETGVTMILHRVFTVRRACCPLGSFKDDAAFQNSAIVRPG